MNAQIINYVKDYGFAITTTQIWREFHINQKLDITKTQIKRVLDKAHKDGILAKFTGRRDAQYKFIVK